MTKRATSISRNAAIPATTYMMILSLLGPLAVVSDIALAVVGITVIKNKKMQNFKLVSIQEIGAGIGNTLFSKLHEMTKIL